MSYVDEVGAITVRVATGALETIAADALVLNWFTDEKDAPPSAWAALDKALGNALSEAIKGDTFKGEIYELEAIYTAGRLPARRIVLVCAGKQARFSALQLRN